MCLAENVETILVWQLVEWDVLGTELELLPVRNIVDLEWVPTMIYT